MSATLADAKAALRIETADFDVMLQGLLDAANHAVAEASGVTDWTDHPNLNVAALMLVATWHDAATPADLSDGMPAPVVALINLSRTGWVAA